MSGERPWSAGLSGRNRTVSVNELHEARPWNSQAGTPTSLTALSAEI